MQSKCVFGYILAMILSKISINISLCQGPIDAMCVQTVKKLYLSFHRQKMASVPISSAYVKQLERNSMSETKAQSNGTELAKYEKNQDIAQERRPFSSCICNVQTMLQSSLQSLPFFSSAPSEQRFKECVDRP